MFLNVQCFQVVQLTAQEFNFLEHLQIQLVIFQELKLIGEFGLRNKREVWRVKYTLAKIRKAARTLLTLEEKVCVKN